MDGTDAGEEEAFGFTGTHVRYGAEVGVDPVSWTLHSFGEEVHDGKGKTPISGGVQAADGGVGPSRATPEELSREFEPTAQSIHTWVRQYERDSGERHDRGLTTPESEELRRLRRENKQLKLERDILSKAAAWFARETGTIPDGSSGS